MLYQNESGCGVGSRFCTFIVNTSLFVFGPKYGSAIATRGTSCCGVGVVASPLGSVAMTAPGATHGLKTCVVTLAELLPGFESGLVTESVALFVRLPPAFVCTVSVIFSRSPAGRSPRLQTTVVVP